MNAKLIPRLYSKEELDLELLYFIHCIKSYNNKRVDIRQPIVECHYNKQIIGFALYQDFGYRIINSPHIYRSSNM